MGAKTTDFVASQNLSAARAADVLACAFEGGSNYWYMIVKFEKPTSILPSLSEWAECRHLSYPLSPGGALVIEDKEAEPGQKKRLYRLDRDAIEKGWQVMVRKFPKHAADILNENDDATTGDVFLQCCVFGDAIYG